MARDSIHPNTPGLDTSFAVDPVDPLQPLSAVPLTTRVSKFPTDMAAGSMIAALVDPFGSGSTFATIGTVPAQLALVGAGVVRGFGAVIADTQYAITIMATSADATRTLTTRIQFRAQLPGGGATVVVTPPVTPTPSLDFSAPANSQFVPVLAA